MQKQLVKQEKEQDQDNNAFYDQIATDVKQVVIQLVSEAGHGKTSSLRTIVKYCQEKHPNIKWVIFDVSQAWFHNAPVEHRQLVTREKLEKGLIVNKYDCVYELGSLKKDEKRAVVGEIVAQHYRQRYQAKLNDELDDYPFLVFVFEEANIYFGSYALRRNDEFSHVFQEFVSVGRNYKMRGFLIATAEVGEISPSLRRRSRRIYGRIESEGDLRRLRRKDKELAKYVGAEIPRFHFVYSAGEKTYGPVRVPDAVDHEPADFIPETERNGEKVKQPQMSRGEWWSKFFQSLSLVLIVVMFILYFLK